VRYLLFERPLFAKVLGMPSAQFGVPSKGWWLLSTLLVLCGNSVWGLEDKSLVRIHSAERNLYDSLHAFGYTYFVKPRKANANKQDWKWKLTARVNMLMCMHLWPM